MCLNLTYSKSISDDPRATLSTFFHVSIQKHAQFQRTFWFWTLLPSQNKKYSMPIVDLSLHFSKFFWRVSFSLHSNFPRFSNENHFPQRLSQLIKLTNLKISSRNLIKIAKCYLFDEFSWDWRSRIFFIRLCSSCCLCVEAVFICWGYSVWGKILTNLPAWRRLFEILLQLISTINCDWSSWKYFCQKTLKIKFWTSKRLNFNSVSFSDQTWNNSINQI